MIEKLEKLLAEATSGDNWHIYDSDDNSGMVLANKDSCIVVGEYLSRRDAALIVALRNLAPELLAVVRAADALNKARWESDFDDCALDVRDAYRALEAKIGELS